MDLEPQEGGDQQWNFPLFVIRHNLRSTVRKINLQSLFKFLVQSWLRTQLQLFINDVMTGGDACQKCTGQKCTKHQLVLLTIFNVLGPKKANNS